jgi:hypothetical protein
MGENRHMASRRAMLGALSAILLAGGGGIVACAPELPPPPPAAAVEDRVAVVAVVESVDQRTRDVLLRGPSGALLTVKAGPEVRNLAQVRPGDRVFVAYRQAIAVQLRRPGEALPPGTREVGAARAARGERPAGAAFDAVRVRVRIDAVDRRNGTVTFTGPNRVTRTVEVRDPAMRDFARGLRPGDEVEIEYLEALAVSVEPALR